MPSGRAFGYIAYPPRDDGKDTYNEGYVFEGDGDARPGPRRRGAVAPDAHAAGRGRLVRARDRGRPDGDDHGRDGGVDLHGDAADEVGGGLQLQQAITRYTWDGETANGMLERSTPLASLA